jgi:hypothetical protein
MVAQPGAPPETELLGLSRFSGIPIILTLPMLHLEHEVPVITPPMQLAEPKQRVMGLLFTQEAMGLVEMVRLRRMEVLVEAERVLAELEEQAQIP